MAEQVAESGAAASDAGAFDPAEHARSMVGYHYRTEDYYEVGREKVREYACLSSMWIGLLQLEARESSRFRGTSTSCLRGYPSGLWE